MTNSETLAMFKSSGALLDGHFRLTSGRHSNSYFQCAKVLQYPEYLSAICGQIAGFFRESGITTVISPAIGGIVVGTEVGRQLGVKTIFAERKEGAMMIRRGFSIDPSEQVLVVEDVITTGGSVAEVIELVKAAGATVAGVASVVDRSNGKVRLADKQFSLLTMEVVSYAPEECPLCKEEIPIYAPGSRTNPPVLSSQMQQGIHTISFVGLGLIGASLMQALKRAAGATGRNIEMIGFDPAFDAADIVAITGECGLDRFEPDPAKLYNADLVVLCAPVVTNIALLDEAKRHIRKDTLVSDVSSTKAEIAAKAQELGIEFIGMHPIAGREQQGYQAASPELLDGRLVILCTECATLETTLATELAGLLRAAGCKPLFMSPEEHDRVYANISHLPQLISTALMAHCRENVEWAGPGFASMARLAGSPWAVWRDIVETNRSNIADEMEAFSALLADVAGEVRGGNFEALESKFREANDLYQRLQERSSS